MAIVAGSVKVDALEGFLYRASSAFKNLNYMDKVVGKDTNANDIATAKASYIFATLPVLLGEGYKPIPNGTPLESLPASLQKTAAQASSTDASKINILQTLVPIGLCQSVNVQTGSQDISFGEIGSELDRDASGKKVSSAQITRVVSSHSDIKYAMYSGIAKFLAGNTIFLLRRPGANGNAHFTGLYSDLYHLHFGLVVLTGNARGEFLKASFLEKCKIQNEGSGININQLMLFDNIAIKVGREIPLIDNQGDSMIPVLGSTNYKLSDYVDRVSFSFPEDGMTKSGQTRENIDGDYSPVAAPAPAGG